MDDVTTRAECEQVVNYEETARLATEAFASLNRVILPERLRWFYERCFSLGATVIALRNGDRKVGQIAMVRQTLRLNGQEESAAQLVDLFICKEFRGKERLQQLYAEVERQFVKQDIRFAIGMPNAKALGVNEYFFKLKPFLRLPFSMGVAIPLAAAAGHPLIPLRSFKQEPGAVAAGRLRQLSQGEWRGLGSLPGCSSACAITIGNTAFIPLMASC